MMVVLIKSWLLVCLFCLLSWKEDVFTHLVFFLCVWRGLLTFSHRLRLCLGTFKAANGKKKNIECPFSRFFLVTASCHYGKWWSIESMRDTMEKEKQGVSWIISSQTWYPSEEWRVFKLFFLFSQMCINRHSRFSRGDFIFYSKY